MLARAHVLGDGRRVFLTEDRTQAFDEFGVTVGRDELDYDLVDRRAPTWEAFSKERELEQALQTEREELIAFQDRVEEVREEIEGNEIPADELEALDAELLEMMPSSVKERVSDIAPVEPAEKLANAPRAAPRVVEIRSDQGFAAPTIPQ